MKRNRLDSQKDEDLIYVHSNLRLASCRGLEYSSGPCKDWDVEPETADLNISLVALNIVDEPRSGVGISSSNPQSSIQRASCSIFEEEFDDQDDDY